MNKTMTQANARLKAGGAGAPGGVIRTALPRMREQIALALPKMIDPDRFYRIVLTALSNNPKLEECTLESFMGAMMQSAQLGLEPNTPLGQAYLIPYYNKGKGAYECQFQIGSVS